MTWNSKKTVFVGSNPGRSSAAVYAGSTFHVIESAHQADRHATGSSTRVEGRRTRQPSEVFATHAMAGAPVATSATLRSAMLEAIGCAARKTQANAAAAVCSRRAPGVLGGKARDS